MKTPIFEKGERRMIKKIYFDMDGVLADFDRGVREFCGMDAVSQDYGKKPGMDTLMWKRASKIPHFYDQLELMPGAKEMFDAVYNRYQDRCEILTGIPKPHRGMIGSAEDKTAWVRRLLSRDIVVHTVFKEQKPQFCFGRDCILIDDLQRNIDAWEKTGGTGILHRSSADTLQILKDLNIL